MASIFTRLFASPAKADDNDDEEMAEPATQQDEIMMDAEDERLPDEDESPDRRSVGRTATRRRRTARRRGGKRCSISNANDARRGEKRRRGTATPRR